MVFKPRFSTGVWVFGSGVERFAPTGYKPQRSTVEIVHEAAKIKGLEGLEMHYPFEVDEKNVKAVKEALEETGLKAVGVPPVLTQESMWAKGALSALEDDIRRKAVDRVKRSIDVARELGAKIIIIWPGREGFDFPFTTNYIKLWDNYVNSLAEIADYGKELQIAIEYKIEDPSSYLIHGSAGRVLTTILELRERGINNVGINVEFAHAKLAREYVPEAIALMARYKALYHLHYNDIFTNVDLDLFPASVNFLEHAELLYWLYKIDYNGWLGLDLFPRYMDASSMIQESINNVVSLYNKLEKVGWSRIENIVESHDPFKAQQLIRELFLQ